MMLTFARWFTTQSVGWRVGVSNWVLLTYCRPMVSNLVFSCCTIATPNIPWQPAALASVGQQQVGDHCCRDSWPSNGSNMKVKAVKRNYKKVFNVFVFHGFSLVGPYDPIDYVDRNKVWSHNIHDQSNKCNIIFCGPYILSWWKVFFVSRETKDNCPFAPPGQGIHSPVLDLGQHLPLLGGWDWKCWRHLLHDLWHCCSA